MYLLKFTKKNVSVFGKENNFNQNIRLKLACKPVRVLRLAMHTRLIVFFL